MSKPDSRIRILVVDDHPIVRLGIRQMIDAEADLEICGEVDSAEAALQLAQRLAPDLALVDLSLARGTAFGLIRDLRAAAAGLRVLVLSMHDETLFAERVLRAGARGYIMKQAAIEGLIGAIRQVASGRVYVSERIAQGVLERIGDRVDEPSELLHGLTDRELEVFELIGRGGSTAGIARELAVSVKTVETYRSNIKMKLNLKDANELVRFATTWAQGM
ncbi:MAG TPA: response regulator transcription factor [Steroidobacteraceae bacterium]|nr:response regulator transcription factor [Steroidobacteraceae bacterium]